MGTSELESRESLAEQVQAAVCARQARPPRADMFPLLRLRCDTNRTRCGAHARLRASQHEWVLPLTAWMAFLAGLATTAKHL
eukprot:361445-Pyramimonas_sp.AAC.1